MLKQRERVEAAGATAIFVVHDDAALVRRTMLAGIDVCFPVLVDRRRDAYEAWGLKRAPWVRIWADPRVWARYLAVVIRGHRPRRVGADTLQLGGDFVLDSRGVVVYSRPQRTDDRPPVAHLLRALRDAASSERDAGEPRQPSGKPGQLSRRQEHAEGDEQRP